MPAITLDSGLEINYREAGQGETLVLVHGFTSSIWNWDPVWEALAARFRVLALDLPGHGGSSKPLDAPYGVPAFAMNLAEFLRKKEIVNFYLAGHSMGGMVAMTFVLDQAWRGFNPRGLILMATAAKSRDDEQRRQLIRLWRENLKEGKFDLPEKMLRAIFRLAFSPRYARAHAEIVDQAFAVATLVPDPVKLRLMEHLATEYDIRERVGEITLPALILQGSDDAMIQGSHYLRMRLPKNKFYEFPGIGHMLVHEATDWVLPAIVDFISPQFHPQRGGGRTADY